MFKNVDRWTDRRTDYGCRSDWYVISSPMSLPLRLANKIVDMLPTIGLDEQKFSV